MSSAHAQRVAAIAGAQRISDALGYALPQIQRGKDEALGYLHDAQGNAISSIDAGEPLSLGALGTGYDGGRAQYRDASALYQPYVDRGNQAGDVYSGSLGLNGAAGHDAAEAAFRASPGYQWQVDQATDGVARKAASLGVAGSGNTMAAISDRAGHMADAEYGGWQDRLNDLYKTGYSATGAQAGLTKGIGDLDVEQGRDTANIYGGNAARRAGIYTGIGSGMASTATNASNNLASTYLGGQNSIANLGMSAGQASDKAKNENEQTLTSGILGIAGLGTNLLGARSAGGGSVLSGLLSKWGS